MWIILNFTNSSCMQPSDVVGWAILTRVMSVLVMESLVSWQTIAVMMATTSMEPHLGNVRPMEFGQELPPCVKVRSHHRACILCLCKLFQALHRGIIDPTSMCEILLLYIVICGKPIQAVCWLHLKHLYYIAELPLKLVLGLYMM